MNANETTTVIVGGGVIGLCTAYHLAKAINERAAKHKVVLIENAGKVFAATSSTNTGILSYNGFKGDLLPLAQYSYDIWEKLGRENLHFKTSCGYREGVNVAIKSSGGGGDTIPGWVQAKPGWHAERSPSDSKQAIINPVPLGVWLYEQCLHYAVEFRLNTQAISANLSSAAEILSIKVMGNNKDISFVECDKLVVAAGPWTPAVFTKLFPGSSVDLESVISAGEWFVFKNSESEAEIAATFLDDIVGHKLEFAGRNDHTIWATGEKSDVGTVPDVGDVPSPDPVALAKLKAYSDIFLKHPHDQLRVISQGRSYRPENRKQLPIIAAVPSCKLSTSQCYEGKFSVYINSGHGSYGVTLGMGSGKIMAQIVLGDELDLDVSKLDI